MHKNLIIYSLSQVCIDRIRYKGRRTAHECPKRHKKFKNASNVTVTGLWALADPAWTMVGISLILANFPIVLHFIEMSELVRMVFCVQNLAYL